MSWILSVSV